jgi:hypothetical protein
VSEIGGQEWQHEQAEVPHEPRRLLVREVSDEARDLDRYGRSDGEDQRLEPPARCSGGLVLAGQDELLPQPAAVLACELA